MALEMTWQQVGSTIGTLSQSPVRIWTGAWPLKSQPKTVMHTECPGGTGGKLWWVLLSQPPFSLAPPTSPSDCPHPVARVANRPAFREMLCLTRICHSCKIYIFIYILERKGGRQRGRETSMCGCLSRAAHRGLGL